MKKKLLGKTPEELREIAVGCGLPSYAGGQIAQWLYRKRVRSIDEMTNLSKAGRERLSENYEVGVTAFSECMTSSDGTRKYLFPVSCSWSGALWDAESDDPGRVEASCVEAVMIPDQDRKTLCVSSQAGCKMGCRFCMTGRQGFHGNLSAADILSQFISVDESAELTGTVFMGMGEPLDNYENSGDIINANINSRLIENIFFKNSPLHDGALIIADGRIKAAGCILPVSHDNNIPRSMGLRHRSALGIAQATDAVAIVVSEETGLISVAMRGKIRSRQSSADLERILSEICI